MDHITCPICELPAYPEYDNCCFYHYWKTKPTEKKHTETD